MDVRQAPVSHRAVIGRGSGGGIGEWAGRDRLAGSDPADGKERCRESDLKDLESIKASLRDRRLLPNQAAEVGTRPPLSWSHDHTNSGGAVMRRLTHF